MRATLGPFPNVIGSGGAGSGSSTGAGGWGGVSSACSGHLTSTLGGGDLTGGGGGRTAGRSGRATVGAGRRTGVVAAAGGSGGSVQGTAVKASPQVFLFR